MADPARPFAEWSYAVHCCRECLRTLLPSWREISVDVTTGAAGSMRYMATNGQGGMRRRSLCVLLFPPQIAAGDSITALVVAREFERILNALPPDERPLTPA